MGKRRQGNTTPRKTKNNSIEDLVEIEGNESPVADCSRMMMIMSNELKDLKKVHKEYLK
jgi:hypothetical protein